MYLCKCSSPFTRNHDQLKEMYLCKFSLKRLYLEFCEMYSVSASGMKKEKSQFPALQAASNCAKKNKEAPLCKKRVTAYMNI